MSAIPEVAVLTERSAPRFQRKGERRPLLWGGMEKLYRRSWVHLSRKSGTGGQVAERKVRDRSIRKEASIHWKELESMF